MLNAQFGGNGLPDSNGSHFRRHFRNVSMKPKGYCMNNLHVRYVDWDKQVLQVRSPDMVSDLYCTVVLRIVSILDREGELLSDLFPTCKPNCNLVAIFRFYPRGKNIPVRS